MEEVSSLVWEQEKKIKQQNELIQRQQRVLDSLNSKIEKHDRAYAKHDRKFTEIEEEYPLLPTEADDLSMAVKRKGVEAMGGKKAPAYQDAVLRKKVFRDIYHEIKRQYGLIDEKGRELSYKKLKRKYLGEALTLTAFYILPVSLKNEVTELNDI